MKLSAFMLAVSIALALSAVWLAGPSAIVVGVLASAVCGFNLGTDAEKRYGR